MLTKLAIVAAGGAIGSALRYLLAYLGQRPAGEDFPLGILIVNVLGCLGIGLAWGAWEAWDGTAYRREFKLLVIVGLLGGFTTFSTFAWDAIRLLEDGRWGRAGLYVVLTNLLGLLAAWGGYSVWALAAREA